MNEYILECCIDSVNSAVNAEKGGADRLELCGNLVIGGTTPSPCLFKEVRKHTDIPVHVLIRPRFGDFCYNAYEMEIMCSEIRMFRELGADAAVIGVLCPDGTLNKEAMNRLVEAAGEMKITLHRAFDVCKDPYAAMEEAISLGIHTILTSGQGNTCLAGRELIKDLAQRGNGRIESMAGAGVDASVIRCLAAEIPIKWFHMSGKITRDSSMKYRKQGVNMGLPSLSEFEIWETSQEKVREAKNALEEIQMQSGT